MLLLQVMRLMRIAQSKVVELAGLLQAALKAHEVAAVAARVRRQPAAPHAPAADKQIYTLGSADDVGEGHASLPSCPAGCMWLSSL